MAAENKTIGRFKLDGLLPAPRGVPQIEVAFDIDANGILNVLAHDKGTGRQQKITITANSGLTADEIDRMVKEAELHTEEDRGRREEIETRNHADNLVYTTERTLREVGDKVPADIRNEAEGKAAALRSALQSADVSQIKGAMAELEAVLQRVGQEVYSHAGTGAEAGGGYQGGNEHQEGDDSGTVDGEFREV
jgi:molecular chaperone DnaK